MRVVVASRTHALAHARHRATASIDRFTAAANAALSSSANAVGVARSVLASCSRACVATDSKQYAAPVDVPSSRSIIPDAVAARAVAQDAHVERRAVVLAARRRGGHRARVATPAAVAI